MHPDGMGGRTSAVRAGGTGVRTFPLWSPALTGYLGSQRAALRCFHGVRVEDRFRSSNGESDLYGVRGLDIVDHTAASIFGNFATLFLSLYSFLRIRLFSRRHR